MFNLFNKCKNVDNHCNHSRITQSNRKRSDCGISAKSPN